MNINTLDNSSINPLRNMPTANLEQTHIDNSPLNTGKPGNTHSVNISQQGKIGSYISRLPESEQQEIKNYMSDIREQKANGTFDIQESINNAPDAFSKLAKHLDINPKEVVSMMPKDKPNLQGETIPEQSQAGGTLSAYTDIASQSESTDNGKSIFSMFTSWFSDNANNTAE